MQYICIYVYIKLLENTWTPFYTVCPVCDLNYKVLKLGNYVFESRLSFVVFVQNFPIRVREYFANVTSVLQHFRPTILRTYESCRSDVYFVNPTYAGTADLVSM